MNRAEGRSKRRAENWGLEGEVSGRVKPGGQSRSEYLTCEQRLKIGEGVSHAYTRRKSIPGRGKSHGKGPNPGEDSKW